MQDDYSLGVNRVENPVASKRHLPEFVARSMLFSRNRIAARHAFKTRYQLHALDSPTLRCHRRSTMDVVVCTLEFGGRAQ